MLVISTWLWGDKYKLEDVAKLRAGVRRHLMEDHRFVCFSDRQFLLDDVQVIAIPDEHLTLLPGCFARLRLFDRRWQDMLWPVKEPTDRLVNVDLDTVITGPLDWLFSGTEDFMIMRGANSMNPCPYTGALMMIRPGAHPELWDDFTVQEAQKIKRLEFPDDQGWIWHKVPNAHGWTVGPSTGVYAFQKPGWPLYDPFSLPVGARLVTFIGWRKPSGFASLDWVQKHWRTYER